MTAELIERTDAVLNVCKQLGASPDALDGLLQSKEAQQEEIKKKYQKVLDFLDYEELGKSYLDQGFNETEGVFWYGFELMPGLAAVVTSKKEVLHERWECPSCGQIVSIIGKSIGTPSKCSCGRKGTFNHIGFEPLFEMQGYIGDIAPTIKKNNVKAYITGTSKKIDKTSLFQQIKEKINYFMDFGKQQEIADVQSCWVIATHCYTLFNWFPHILFNAPSESGKSKNANVLMQLSFRGFDLGTAGGVSPPQIFRTLEGNRGCTIIDEFERMEKNESQQLVNQILNSSASKDSYIIRVEKADGNKWVSKKFPIYSPKIACNISGINPTSLSRFISFQILKTNDSEKSRRKPQKPKEKKDFEEIRDQISLLILDNWKEIKEIYDKLELKELRNRDEDNWLPICTIAYWIGKDVLNNVLSYVKTYKELRLEADDTTRNMFYSILDNVLESDAEYSATTIAGWMGDLLCFTKNPPSWIGRRMKDYQFKPIRKANANVYILNKKKVQDIIDRYFITESPPQVPPSPQATLHPQAPDNGTCGTSGVNRRVPLCGFEPCDPTWLPCFGCGSREKAWTLMKQSRVYCDDCALSLAVQVEEVLQ